MYKLYENYASNSPSAEFGGYNVKIRIRLIDLSVESHLDTD